MKAVQIVAVWMVMATMVACQNRVAAKTLLITAESVNAAMNVYGALYRQVPAVLTAQEIESVRTTHADYQRVYNEAVVIVQGDLGKLTPVEVGILASNLITLVEQLKEKYSR